ncbi:glycoside hydrolase family 3 N-terminal domain-containing protein [Prosthecomicrobium hirschii]|uniref:glycoside hydrolase family 3 N-terminal domain-containing protein n=1 Tax=Prosthecodimorpha hirschii TaxID=665126 RepID=UPI002220A2E3|nr:glycoside hydrolase family 3 N-terminal domain-containing protein [Prosthecomicrobium hirschii]MCW1840505.1 glycoside hydrolase family 3 C-terminal domain-containing protein [Prosthecomicrobium hirschii]
MLQQMTLAEKLGQLTMISLGGPPTGPVADPATLADVAAGHVGSVLNLVGRDRIATAQTLARSTRLGIPLVFSLDVVHGYRTIFPVPIGEAAAFDPALWQETAQAAAAEARREGIHLTFAPMLDIARDPRWGRIVEGPGEDPWLAARFARAKVDGFQGADLAAAGTLAATAKHFVAYGAAIAGRDYASAAVSAGSLAEVYLPPFRAAVEAGVAAIMPAFSDIDGIPMTAHAALIAGRLRHDWGFDGVVISDWDAIGQLVAHGVAADLAEAAALALNAGVDIDMVSGAYRRGLPEALDRGLVEPEAIDAAVLRVLALKERLGLFEAEAGPAAAAGPPASTDAAGRRALARHAAERGTVLLHDRSGLLPVGSPRKIAVIGPFGRDRGGGADRIGPWAGLGEPDRAPSLPTALRARFPEAEILSKAGVDGRRPGRRGIAGAVAAARAADLVLLCLGEPADWSGEAASRAEPGLPGDQAALAEAIFALGRPTVLILTGGRPLIAPTVIDRAGAALMAWFGGSEIAAGLARILAGDAAAGGRLPVSWPRSPGQLPVFFGERPSGRPYDPDNPFTSHYLDLPNAPQFPFGHGGTPGAFALSGLSVTPEAVGPTGTLSVAVIVANAAARADEAVIFVFIQALKALPNRPVLELRAVERVALAPGETQRLTIPLSAAALDRLDDGAGPEPGRYAVRVGLDAERSRHLVAEVMLGAG